jgi:predicted transcriptional regulator
VRVSGALEQEVRTVLARRGGWMTIADVRAQVDADLAYTTVMTVLARLHAKGEVHRQRLGRLFFYRGSPDLTSLTAQRMRVLLDGERDRAALLARFVGDLGPADRRYITQLLNHG